MKRVEAKEARERGLAFRNPNTSNINEYNISPTPRVHQLPNHPPAALLDQVNIANGNAMKMVQN